MKKGSNIIVGICGGISSYKTAYLVSLLVADGFDVKIIMTEAAQRFITPLTLEALSHNSVYTDMFGARSDATEHIALAQWTDLCVIAPLSANTLSKIACGICDNLLTTVICALGQKIPVIGAPAMNEAMWRNPFIRDNVRKLDKLSQYHIVYPDSGRLACGISGEGRMAEPAAIAARIKTVCKKKKRNP